jgi:hypothetical protein
VAESDTKEDTPDIDINSHDILLESREGRRYRFSLDILARYSHFAEDMLSIPLPPGTDPARDDPPVFELPVSGAAISYMLECFMARCHRRRLDPIPKHLGHDVVTFCDILDCPELFGHLLQQSPDSEVPSKFTLAVLKGDHAKITTLSLPLLGFSADYYTDAWWLSVVRDKSPDVVRQLAVLFENWNASFLLFQSRMVSDATFPPHDNTDFCDQYTKHRGDFGKLSMLVVPRLWSTFSHIPIFRPVEYRDHQGAILQSSQDNIADHIRRLNIDCAVCSATLTKRVKSIIQSWPPTDWATKRKQGLSVSPAPQDLQAWRVYSHPAEPPKTLEVLKDFSVSDNLRSLMTDKRSVVVVQTHSPIADPQDVDSPSDTDLLPGVDSSPDVDIVPRIAQTAQS